MHSKAQENSSTFDDIELTEFDSNCSQYIEVFCFTLKHKTMTSHTVRVSMFYN